MKNVARKVQISTKSLEKAAISAKRRFFEFETLISAFEISQGHFLEFSNAKKLTEHLSIK